MSFWYDGQKWCAKCQRYIAADEDDIRCPTCNQLMRSKPHHNGYRERYTEMRAND